MPHRLETNLRFTGSTNPLTSDFTASADVKLLVVGIVTAGAIKRTGGVPTYNSVEMTQADQTRQHGVNPETSCELWYLSEPGVGSALQISIPNPTSLTLHVQVSSYIVVEGFTSILDVDNGSSGTSASPSVSVTTTEDDDVIVAIFGNGENFTPTANSGIELNTTDNGLYSDSNQYTLPAIAGSVASSWTTQTYGAGVYGGGVYNGDDDWCMCVAAFKEVNVPITVEPDVIPAILTLIFPSITAGTGVSILPLTQTLALTLNAPSILINVAHSPSTLELTLTAGSPDIVIDTIITPTVFSLSVSLGSIAISIGIDITVVVSVVPITTSIGVSDVLAPLPAVRMMPFIFSTEIAYMGEWGNEYARMYFNGEPLLGAGEVHVEIDTPYQSDELYQIQTKQIADVMWAIHGSYPQKKLKRTTPTTFTLEDIEFKKGPFLKRNDLENDDGVTMNCSVVSVGNTGVLTRSVGKFETGHIGSLFKLTHPRINKQTNGSLTGTGIIGEAIEIFGDYTFSITVDGWTATVSLQRSTDNWVTNTNIQTYTGGKQSFSATETTEDVQYRINITSHTVGTVSASLLENSNSVKGTAEAVGVIGVPLDVKGNFNFNTQGNWGATVVLERNENSAGWEPYRTYVSKIINGVGSRNVQFSATEQEDNVQYRINVTSYTDGTVNADLGATSSSQSGIVRINNVASDLTADITVVSKISQTTDTIRWAEGAWSDVRGYPAAVGFFEERIIYGGSSNNPNRVWLSEIDDYENFETGTNASDSFELDLQTTESIRWISALDALIVGTGGEEFRIRASEIDAALTPGDFNIRAQTARGGAPIQAIEVGSIILFVDSIGRKIREFVYSDPQQKFVSSDLSALAEDITVSGIVNIAYQKNPESILWCVLDNGKLVTLSYEREQNVIAWANQPMDGLVQSVAIIPGILEDEVWISITRSINGSTVNYIEQFHPRILDIRKENAFFIDSGVIYGGPSITLLTGLDHLEAKEVSILANGVVLDNQKVVGGQVTVPSGTVNARAGRPYTSSVIPMRMDISTRSGTTHGTIKKVPELVVSFKDTIGAKYGETDTTLFDFNFDEDGLKNTSKIEGLFTGDVTSHFDGGFDLEDDIIISQSQPLPCIVRAIVPRMDVMGR